MHLDARELFEDCRRVDERGPVVLQVLARCEMSVALVVPARDLRQLEHLPRIQRAVGNGDAQHVGVQLKIEAVHQPVGLELILGHLARETALDLRAERGDALGDEARVEFVIAIHVRLRSSIAPAAR